MIRTPNDELDRYFNVWSKYQNRNQVRFCRALDKVGYRDVLQDMMGVCDFESDLVRDRLMHTLRYQAADGRPRQEDPRKVDAGAVLVPAQFGHFSGSGSASGSCSVSASVSNSGSACFSAVFSRSA